MLGFDLDAFARSDPEFIGALTVGPFLPLGLEADRMRTANRNDFGVVAGIEGESLTRVDGPDPVEFDVTGVTTEYRAASDLIVEIRTRNELRDHVYSF